MFKRMRARRLFLDTYQAGVKSGKSKDEAADEAMEAVHNEFGLDLDWGAILELILTIIRLLGI